MIERLQNVVDQYDAGERLRDIRVIGSPIGAIRSCFDLMAYDTPEDWEIVRARMARVPGSAHEPRGVAARRHGARHRRGPAPGVCMRGPGRDVERRCALLPQRRGPASRRSAPRRRRGSGDRCLRAARGVPPRGVRAGGRPAGSGRPRALRARVARVQRHRARLRGDLPVGMGGAVPDRGRDAHASPNASSPARHSPR